MQITLLAAKSPHWSHQLLKEYLAIVHPNGSVDRQIIANSPIFGHWAASCMYELFMRHPAFTSDWDVVDLRDAAVADTLLPSLQLPSTDRPSDSPRIGRHIKNISRAWVK